MRPTLRTLTNLAQRAIVDPPPPPRRPVPTHPQGWPGLYLGIGSQGPVWGGRQHHTLVIGPPRSGKTTRIAMPNLVRHPGAAVVTSTKPDVIAASLEARARIGTCWVWDPTASVDLPDGVEPLCWSPVVGCTDWDQAVATAHALAGAARPDRGASDYHWVERAQAVLAPLLHAAALFEATLPTVLSWLHRRELLQPLSLLEEAGAHIASDLLHGVALTDPRELSGILSTADSLLAAYRTNAALEATRNPTFAPDRFAASTDTIYLCSPAASHHLHAPLVVALLDQIRTAIYRQAVSEPVLWILDELAHIAPLPDLAATIAEGGSQGLIVLACLQDLSQARTRWHQAADGFLTLFTHKIVLPGIADIVTLRQISDLAGQIEMNVPSTSRDDRLIAPTTTSWHRQFRPRLPVDQVAAGRPGEALLLTRTHSTRVRI
jgi:type IV secretion system protein VirD4